MLTPNETGIVVISIGASVFVLGAMLLMDKALMISGNILIIFGIGLLVRSRMLSLLKPEKIQGTAIFVLGILFLFYNFAFFGLILEVFGLFVLFKDNLPTFRNVLKNLIFGKMSRFMK